MKAKKIYVVKHFKSPYIEEAIFVLRENAPPDVPLPDAVEEAERIVTGYLERMNAPRVPKKNGKGKLFAVLSCLIGLLGLCIALL